VKHVNPVQKMSRTWQNHKLQCKFGHVQIMLWTSMEEWILNLLWQSTQRKTTNGKPCTAWFTW